MTKNYAHIFPHSIPGFKPNQISIAVASHCVYWKQLYGPKHPDWTGGQLIETSNSSNIPIPSK